MGVSHKMIARSLISQHRPVVRVRDIAAGQRALVSNGAACVGTYMDKMGAASQRAKVRRIIRNWATTDPSSVVRDGVTNSGGNDGKRSD